MSSWHLFSILILLLLAGIQFYSYKRLRNYLKGSGKFSWLVSTSNLLFIAFNLPIIALFLFKLRISSLPDWTIPAGIYPLYIWHFSIFLIFVLLMLGKILKIPILSVAWLAKKHEPTRDRIEEFKKKEKFLNFDLRRRMFLRKSVSVMAGAAFVGSTYAAFGKDDHEVTELDVPVKDLPKEFEGYTISLISDIHSSSFMTRERMSEYADAVNKLNSDLIAVTGDFVNSMVEEVYPFAEAFSTLQAKDGVYGVLGNHDYFTKNVELVAREINASGIRLLRDEKVLIRRQDQQIALLGVDDVGSYRRAATLFDSTLAGLDKRTSTVLMCHRPYFFSQAAERRIDLTLSGHTHGGQIVFAKLGRDVFAPARVVSPYVSGLYKLGSSNMYVSRGIGTVGIPMRFNCPPEITKLRLVKAQPEG